MAAVAQILHWIGLDLYTLLCLFLQFLVIVNIYDIYIYIYLFNFYQIVIQDISWHFKMLAFYDVKFLLSLLL